MLTTPLIGAIWARLDSNDAQIIHNKNQWVPDTNIYDSTKKLGRNETRFRSL